ncbi:MAG: NTP transferase domain-containing protein [Planctomycetota bacterium]
MSTTGEPIDAIILGAGKGTRMNSDLPKVAHEAAGRAMVTWVVDACFAAGVSRVVLVVGHGREIVEDLFSSHPHRNRLSFALQAEQLGTGHAVLSAREAFEPISDAAGDVLVLCGDGPLIRAGTLEQLIARHREVSAVATLATAVLDDPSGYGRVVRDERGGFARIVEQKNASPEQLTIREVNPSYYCFRTPELFSALDRVERNVVSGEYYVTDVPALLLADGGRVEVIDAVPAEDVLSVNTPAQLAEVESVLQSRASSSPAEVSP